MNKKASKPKEKPPAAAPGAPAWLLFFVACGFMFILGVLVGRNTMPVRFDMADLNEQLGRLQKSVLAEDAETLETETLLESMPFEFYEKLRDDPIRVPPDDDDMPLRLIEPKFEKDPPASKTLVGVAPDDKPPRTRQQAEKRPAPPSPDTSREAAESSEIRPLSQEKSHGGTGPADGAERGYVIQVASLRDRENAETVRDKFKSRGYPAYTREAVVEGQGKWTRVRIGPYDDREQARKDLVRLQEAGVDAILLVE